MRKLVIGLAILLVIAMVMPVMAAGKSDIRHFDVIYDGITCGKLTVNVETGHYTLNINMARYDAKAGTEFKDMWKEEEGKTFSILGINAEAPYNINFGSGTINKGGNWLAKGYITGGTVFGGDDELDQQTLLNWIDVYGAGAEWYTLFD